MKHESTRKVVMVEEHHVLLSKQDLLAVMESQNPEELLTEADIQPMLHLGDSEKAMGARSILDLVRVMNKDIPENAEVVLAVRWREETESQQQPQQPQQQMMMMPAQMMMQPPVTYQPPQQHAGRGLQQPPPMQQQQAPPPVVQAQQCRTCGAVPDLQGPTPDCMDAMGCAHVRSQRGNLPVPTSVLPDGGPSIGLGGGGDPTRMPGTQMLVNRETGEKKFASRDGTPYGGDMQNRPTGRI